MSEKMKKYVVPHFIGLIVIFIGWYISILHVGLARFQQNVLFTKTTLLGLVLIIIGAYIPEVWIKIRK